jgi:alanine racemase
MDRMPQTWTELDTGALEANIRALRAVLAPSVDVIFVVKSDAYGHGVADVVPASVRAGIRRFAVAHLDEALAVRGLAPDAAILILGPLEPEDVPEALAADIVPTLVDARGADAVADAARAAGGVLPCHVKIDTGMGRLGLPWETAPETIARLARRPELRLAGAYTHLASGDAPDRSATREQARRFDAVTDACRARGVTFPLRHMANSGAIERDADADLDAVRPGLLLYGYGLARARADTAPARPVDVQPVLHWKARVIQVKDVPAGFAVSYAGSGVVKRPTRLATISVGYADGYPRALGNRGAVLLHGRRCPVVGWVTMNMLVVDTGPDGAVQAGDTAVLLGAEGGEAIWADTLAAWCGTIPYEIVTGIRVRARRVMHPPASQ